MWTSEVIAEYGSQSATARALGLDPSTVCGWGEFPPPLRQLQIEALTRGRLKAEPGCDKYRVPVVPPAVAKQKVARPEPADERAKATLPLRSQAEADRFIRTLKKLAGGKPSRGSKER